MTEFLNSALSFPTIIFSIFFCISLILWLFTAFGLFGFDADVDVDGDITVGEAVGFLSRFGLGGVPITIVVSCLSLFGWMTSFLLQSWILNRVGLAIIYYPLGIVVFIVALIVAVYFTALVCRPLRFSLKSQEAPSNKHFIGRVVTVRSSSVNMKYGEAIMDDGGAGLILKIRAEESQGFKQGDKVVLLEFLDDIQAYHVISEDEFNGI
ncbi:hypothetical protein [Neisseria sp. Ec49-e6-T10]|uniref:hypothetical protein n=1 Tax=Neisseria sp. Ec49-e6-T10 TaxID=3140744 RepID=UPI003EBFEC25